MPRLRILETGCHLEIISQQFTCFLEVVGYCLSTLKSSGSNAHSHWLQLTQSRSPIMLYLKAWPADYEDSEPCIFSGTVTEKKRSAAFACGQEKARFTDCADQLRVNIKACLKGVLIGLSSCRRVFVQFD